MCLYCIALFHVRVYCFEPYGFTVYSIYIQSSTGMRAGPVALAWGVGGVPRSPGPPGSGTWVGPRAERAYTKIETRSNLSRTSNWSSCTRLCVPGSQPRLYRL